MTKPNPLVSIVVITYNSSKYVLETLESAKGQNYQNIELIVSDDCSTDNTAEVCRSWIEENKVHFVRTKFVSAEKNTGIPANCNRGISSARGEWVKLIAGDDVFEETCICDNLNYALEMNASFVFSELSYFSEKNFKYADDINEKELRELFSKLSSKGQLKFYSRLPIFLNSPTWFYRKADVAQFDEDFTYLEDQPFVFRMLESSIKAEFLDKKTIRYRKHEGTVQNNNPKLKEEFVQSYKKYRKKYLHIASIIDILFIINFHINNVVMRAPNSMFMRYILMPIRKLNPVLLLKIAPTSGFDK